MKGTEWSRSSGSRTDAGGYEPPDFTALRDHNRATLTGAFADAWAAVGPAQRRADAAPTPAQQAIAVMAALAGPLGRTVEPPSGLDSAADPLTVLLAYAGVRHRRVRLADGWQRSTVLPMAGFGVDGRPLALVPTARGYRIVDPCSGRSTRAGSAAAPQLAPYAYALYRPLAPGPVTLRSLLRFGLAGSTADVRSFLLAGGLYGLLAAVVPTSVGTVVPLLLSGGPRQLWWVAVLLTAFTATAALMLLVRNAAVIRLQGRLQASVEPAVWDRLLAHDAAFFRRFSTGDLVQRGNSVAEARRALSDVLVSAVLGAVFSLVSVVVVFAADVRLGALLAAGLGAIGCAMVGLARRRQTYETRVWHAHGDVYGTLYPLLLGIDKLQVAGREIQAFARWATAFGRQKTADNDAMRVQAVSAGLAAAIQPLLAAVLLGGITVFHLTVGIGDLLVAGVAVGQVALAIGQLGQVADTAFGAVPVLRRLGPILAAPREVAAGDRDPGRLTGTVALDGVSFCYPGSPTPVLDGVQLRAESGEFVAVVGPSGAGKSTLVRLLLGFERPEHGTVRYDGQDLAGLDVRAVRRQIGSVLQNGKLLRGTLLENLIGADDTLTERDVWRAAELAGIAEELRNLPMGLSTATGEDAQSFSGGQTQRLLLAKALLREPSVLLLDEATSALDNTTQRLVSERIAALECTRIVIAHRLSTIRHADRIYVLDAGRVRAEGAYRELVRSDAVFATLVKHQEL